MWTDGSCEPNPGVGGWAVILIAGENKKKLSGRLPESTSSRSELTAVIEGLNALRGGPHDVTLYTDSEYVRRAVEGMKKPKMNFDLLQQVVDLCAIHNVRVCHVSAHAGVACNEECDLLANKARE